MEKPEVFSEKKDAITTITIYRPDRKNAVRSQTLDLLWKEMAAAAEDESVRVVVLTGVPGAFCAGADLKEGFAGEDPMERVMETTTRTAQKIITWMVNMPKPVITKVDGPAVGFGCNLALGADIVIASERARFSEIFVKVGLATDGGGAFFLPRLVGLRKAFELVLTGDFVEGKKAEEIGLVTRVVPVADLDRVVDELAQKLARGPRRAMAATKAAIYRGLTGDLLHVLEMETQAQINAVRNGEFTEGAMAFIQRRDPDFRNI